MLIHFVILRFEFYPALHLKQLFLFQPDSFGYLLLDSKENIKLLQSLA